MEPVGGRACPVEACLLPFPGPGQPFFLSLEGVLSSSVSGRDSSLNPKAWYLLAGNSFLLLFPAYPRWAGGSSILPSQPVSQSSVFTPQLHRFGCANSLPSSFWRFPVSVQMCESCIEMLTFASQRSLENRNLCWGTSLVVQWLRIHLPMRGTRFRALVREDPTCRWAAKHVCHNCWSPRA